MDLSPGRRTRPESASLGLAVIGFTGLTFLLLGGFSAGLFVCLGDLASGPNYLLTAMHDHGNCHAQPVNCKTFGWRIARVSNPKWGSKRICLGCGAKFYDLRKSPIICPSCGAEFDPEALLKSRRGRSAPKPEPAAAKPKKAKAAPVGDDDDESDAEEEDFDIDDAEADAAVGDDDDDDYIEDTSDLGDDDVSDVVVGDDDKEDT